MKLRDSVIGQILSIVLVLFVTMILVSGGTFAYFRWASDVNTQKSALNIKVTEKISMHIENPEISDTGLYPTNNCAGAGAMPISDSGSYSADPSVVTIDNQTGIAARPRFKLKVKITDVNGNVITNNASVSDSSKPYRYYINYAIAEVGGDCTTPLFTGKFDQNTPTSTGNGWYNSGWVTSVDVSTFPILSNGVNSGVSFQAKEYGITTHEYQVWAWIDSSYTTTIVGNQASSDPMQNATISISWSEDSTVHQIR